MLVIQRLLISFTRARSPRPPTTPLLPPQVARLALVPALAPLLLPLPPLQTLPAPAEPTVRTRLALLALDRRRAL
jgi:hypothetical protein